MQPTWKLARRNDPALKYWHNSPTDGTRQCHIIALQGLQEESTIIRHFFLQNNGIYLPADEVEP